MKRLWALLALILLVACAPVAVVPPTEPTEPPPPPAETTEAPPPPAETTVPPLVALPNGNLPDAPYTPLAAPARYYPETVLDLIPNAGYGRIFPYVGKGEDKSNGAYWDGYLVKYGLCTEKGVIVCDPTYDGYALYGDAAGGMYALTRHLPRGEEAKAFDRAEMETTLAAFDGSWVFKTQDVAYECQYGATVQVDGLWGVLGYDGQWLLPPEYEGPLYFACGLAPVVSADRETYYYINIAGQTVLGPYSTENADFFGWTGLHRVESEDGKTYSFLDMTSDSMVPVLGPFDIDYVPWDKLLGSFLSSRSFINNNYGNVPRYFAWHKDGYLFQNCDIISGRIYYLNFDPEIFYYHAPDTDESEDNVALSINGVEKIYPESRDAEYIADGGGRIIIDHFFDGGNTVLDINGETLFSHPSGELWYSGGYYFAYEDIYGTGERIVYDSNFNELLRTDGAEVRSVGTRGHWITYGVGERYGYRYKYGILDERGEVLLPAIYDELSEVNGMLSALRGTRSYLFDAELNCVLELDITDGG